MNSDIEIYDNYLPDDYFKYLKGMLLNSDANFSWNYSDFVVDENNKDVNEFQFAHIFYQHNVPVSPFFNELAIIFQKLNPLTLIKVKANLLPKTTNHIEHGMHVDIVGSNCQNLRTSILYINTNNGYTLFEDNTKINSVENRMVIFPTHMRHTGATCTDEKIRVVINFNFLCWKN